MYGKAYGGWMTPSFRMKRSESFGSPTNGFRLIGLTGLIGRPVHYGPVPTSVVSMSDSTIRRGEVGDCGERSRTRPTRFRSLLVLRSRCACRPTVGDGREEGLAYADTRCANLRKAPCEYLGRLLFTQRRSTARVTARSPGSGSVSMHRRHLPVRRASAGRTLKGYSRNVSCFVMKYAYG